MLGKKPLDELECEAAQSVTVGNHHFCDSSLHDSVQKGEKSPALEVEPRTDIADDLVLGESAGHVSDLSLEVVALLGRGDPTIDHV